MDLLERLKGTAIESLADLDDESIPVESRARRKLRMAAIGKDDWERLFFYYNLDRSGDLDFREFKQIIRRDAGITPRLMSEHELQQVFDSIDDDKSGDIDVEEFTDWLAQDDDLAADHLSLIHI